MSRAAATQHDSHSIHTSRTTTDSQEDRNPPHGTDHTPTNGRTTGPTCSRPPTNHHTPTTDQADVKVHKIHYYQPPTNTGDPAQQRLVGKLASLVESTRNPNRHTLTTRSRHHRHHHHHARSPGKAEREAQARGERACLEAISLLQDKVDAGIRREHIAGKSNRKNTPETQPWLKFTPGQQRQPPHLQFPPSIESNPQIIALINSYPSSMLPSLPPILVQLFTVCHESRCCAKGVGTSSVALGWHFPNACMIIHARHFSLGCSCVQ